MLTSAPLRKLGSMEKIRRSASSNEKIEIYGLFMADDGTFPNNKDYPLLLFKGAYFGSQAEAIQIIMKSRKWTTPWVWGIFTFHHYHSTAWELLLCIQGDAEVQLGGANGPIVEIHRGDMILIPPGFAHKQLGDSDDFTLLGSYPLQREHDLGPVDTLRLSPTTQQRANILSCSVPANDPFLGLHLDELLFSTVANPVV